ncbi:MAG TPA: 2-(1,2-epoxy-1,2-dihydrophenyl)acetyl-CoA isomerase PaaG [Gemmatimonadaceae bacterium]|nr:2-(1,2-epoxy-1,2-dihydrophenyl)acetyl-CoA isomerase PaaG [Gemmatimonadaceae bacterium]
MSYKFILVTVDESVMRITLNRPEVLNSFTLAMSHEVRDALESARADKLVRAILITGAGRGFCAGQDLTDVPPAVEGRMDLGATVRQTYNPVVTLIRKLEKPVVCAVNGVAAGAGANLAIACDIVIASETASFIQSFAKIGLIPDSGGTFFLPRTVGLPVATALMMLGEKITAQRAAEIGMIYKVVGADELEAEALKVARQLAEMPTKGLGFTKRALNASLGNDLAAQLAVEEELQREAGHTADFAEGVAAFNEKRKPNFRGE